MYHFGYGSNLNASFVRDKLLPSAKYLMKGYLPNFEVQFRLWSEDHMGGISSIVEAPGQIVQGAIYECSQQDLEKLDYLPGLYVPQYKRETFAVLGEDCSPDLTELNLSQDCCGKEHPARSHGRSYGAHPKF